MCDNAKFLPCMLAVLASLAILPSHALAGATVRYKVNAGDAWGTVPAGVIVTNVGATNPVSIENAVAGYYLVRSNARAAEDLGVVSFVRTQGTGVELTLLIGDDDSTDIIPTQSLPIGCRDWRGLSPGAEVITLQAHVGRDVVSQSVIEANRIVRLDVDGDVIRPTIRHTSTTLTLDAINVGGAITDNLSDTSNPPVRKIESAGGKIVLVRAAHGIQVPILCTNGPIGQIIATDATDGDIGGARGRQGIPPNYDGTDIVGTTIDLIQGRVIRSNIVASTGIKQIQTLSGLRGTLNTPTLLNIDATTGGRIKAGGGCDMGMTFTTELPSNARIILNTYFGYPFESAFSANQPVIKCTQAGGLKGEIILNAAQPTYPITVGTASVTQPLFAPIEVGSGSSAIQIVSPTYTFTGPQLGGGAVGVTPFNLHFGDSSPAHAQIGRYDGKLESEFTATSVPILICSYGPVKLESGISVDQSVVIECQSESDPCMWFNVTTMFEIIINPSQSGPGSGRGRSIGLKRAGSTPPKAAIYRVVPQGLVCDSIEDSSTLVTWDENCTNFLAYQFRVGPDCPTQGQQGVNDLFEIDQSRDPVTGISPLDLNNNDSIDACDATDECRCDWNDSNTISVQDIFDFLTCYFGPPASCFH